MGKENHSHHRKYKLGKGMISLERTMPRRHLKLNKSIIPLPICHQMREFALQHTETLKVNQKEEKNRGEMFTLMFWSSQSWLSWEKMLGEAEGNTKTRSHSYPTTSSLHCMFPQVAIPRGERLPGISMQMIELFDIIMHNTTINQHQIPTPH